MSVTLKSKRDDDFDFLLFQNAADIGGFEVPWGPWGFNSYMFSEPVSRAEAEALKVIRKGQQFLRLYLYIVCDYNLSVTLKRSVDFNYEGKPPRASAV